ncbi:MAG TPA: NAD+ synthase, partial [Candidatus Sulfotelmatobacter sp.]|nr:NAD+ synthase [Candidatus Sulfotelmatobacter sp.]
MKLALAQINPTVGDLPGNAAKISALIEEAREQKADLVIFPELAVSGYPPEDLLFKQQFVADNRAALAEIVKHCRGIAVYLGFIDRKGKALYNAGAFIVNGRVKHVYRKMNLPNYGVFDELRYFQAGSKPLVVALQGLKIGLGICEDIWVEKGPYRAEVKAGARLVLNINASPYHRGKLQERQKLLSARAKKAKAYIVYVNQVGGQDELIFDGGSMVFDPQGKLIAACDQFREEMLIFDLFSDRQTEINWLDEIGEVYGALVLGVKDYVQKNGFAEVVIGVSGGIDSALTLALAVDALGKEKVRAIYMPSDFSAAQSKRDARQVAKNLGVEFTVIPIKEVMTAYLQALTPNFRGRQTDVTEENLQARIRGNYLMALANKFNWLVLTTGNKSEMSTGYCTLYGDMAGGFAAIKDAPKTLVYQLVEWRNKQGEIVPRAVIDRPPTAELKPDQTDQDTLPPYDILDAIMKDYVEDNLSAKQIVVRGYDETVVNKVIGLIDRAEYKRRQAPPGPRLTPRAFGKDWRLPIT